MVLDPGVEVEKLEDVEIKRRPVCEGRRFQAEGGCSQSPTDQAGSLPQSGASMRLGASPPSARCPLRASRALWPAVDENIFKHFFVGLLLSDFMNLILRG